MHHDVYSAAWLIVLPALYLTRSKGASRNEHAVLHRTIAAPVFRLPDDHMTADATTITGCTELAIANGHPRDKQLRFQAEGHSYFWNDKLVDCSAPWLS